MTKVGDKAKAKRTAKFKAGSKMKPKTKRFVAPGGRNVPPTTQVVILALAVIIGSLLIGLGVNSVLLSTGVRHESDKRVEAVATTCTKQNCDVTYTYNNVSHTAVFHRSPGKKTVEGQHYTVSVFPPKYSNVYDSAKPRLAVGILLTGVGIASLIFGTFKLYRFWKIDADIGRAGGRASKAKKTKKKAYVS